MNTDKLMELESLATDMDNFGHDLYQGGQALSDFADRARTIAAALRAEQAVGGEQVARELLAEELRREGMHEDAYPVGCGGELTPYAQAALRAIRRALGTARQSEGVVLVPKRPTEAMLEAGRDAVMARDCSSNEWGPADHYEAAGISRKGMPDHLFEGKGKMSKAWGAELVYAAMLAAAPGGEGEG